MHSKRIRIIGTLITLILALSVAYAYLAQKSAPGTSANPVQTPPIGLGPSPTGYSPELTNVPRLATVAPTQVVSQPAKLMDVPIRLAWFYKPPNNGNLDLLARYFDLFILTKTDEPARDTLRAKSLRTPFLQYLRFDAIQDRGSCAAQPYRDQVADKPGDFCAILQAHPDWILWDRQGHSIAELTDGGRYVFTDPGNSSWRAFWLERARTSQEQLGWDGLFLDNVAASRNKFAHLNTLPAIYADDSSFQAAVEGFLEYLATYYARPTHRPLYANIIDLDDPSVWFRYLTYLDGVMEEAFAVGWRNEYLSVQEWESQAGRIEKAQALGKQVILVSQGPQDDLPREQFAFASYLLVNQGGATFRYTNDRSYDQTWLYANYQVKLGQATGPRFRNGTSWERDFTAGKVILDPATHSSTIMVY